MSSGAETGSPRQRPYDAIVVGTGAAGGWAAKELCEKGLSVLLLDAGPELDLRAEFPVPARPRRRLLARASAALGSQQIQLRHPVFDSRTRRLFVNDRENPYSTPAGAPFNWFRGRQVGGRMHVWAGISPRLSDFELRAASADGHGADWPLDYRELAPYYDRVETFLGVHGEPAGLPVLPDGRYIAPIPLTGPERSFKSAVESVFPECRVISARRARRNSNTVLPTIQAAQQTGRLVLRSDAVVRSVLTDPADGMATGVSFVDRSTRQPHEARGKLVVLCASAIETVRIMLNSASPKHPAGLGNSSGRLGHGLMDHVETGIGGPLSERELIGDGGTTDPYDIGAETGFQVPRFRNIGAPHGAFLRGYGLQGGIGRGPGWYLLAHGEMLSRPENRVTLNPDRTDAWGIPVAHISCTPSPNEVAMAEDQIEVMTGMAAAAGLRVRTPPSGGPLSALAYRLWRRRLLSQGGAFLPGTAAHELGGAAMGDDPRESVLNRFNQCWDAENVLVTDGGSFTSGCWQNVALTIMALTVRACDHLAREYRAGRVGG